MAVLMSFSDETFFESLALSKILCCMKTGDGGVACECGVSDWKSTLKRCSCSSMHGKQGAVYCGLPMLQW